MKTQKVRSYTRNKKPVEAVYPGVAIYLYVVAGTALIVTFIATRI